MVDNTVYAFTRGNVFVITRNSDSNVPSAQFLLLDADKNPIYPVGSKLANIDDPKDVLTVAQGGVVQTELKDGMPKIYNLVQSADTSSIASRDEIAAAEEAQQYTIGL